SETYIGIAFPAPAFADAKEVLAMDLAVTVLGDGRSSRLYRQLKEEKRIVNSISAGFATHLYPGMAYAVATPAGNNVDEIVQEIWQTFRDLAENPPTESEMAKIRRVIRNGLLFGMET